MLLKATYLRALDVELFPVPHGGSVVKPGETQIASQNLEEFITAYTVPNDEIIEAENELNENNNAEATEETGD